VINTSNHVGQDNPRWLLVPVSRPRRPAEATVADRPTGRPAGSRIRDSLALVAQVALDRLAYFLRRWGDRWFAMNDTEAHWWGWQISKEPGSLGRRYRDTRFDTLAACARCAGADAGEPDPHGGLGQHRAFG
jgi:hypothetical protein